VAQSSTVPFIHATRFSGVSSVARSFSQKSSVLPARSMMPPS
jgi:hypothetical protein